MSSFQSAREIRMWTQYDPPIGAGVREIPAVRRRDLSRRDALRLGALGAGGGLAAVLAGCGGGGKSATVPTIGPDEIAADAGAMASLLEVERTAVIAYGLAEQRLAGRPARGVAREFMRHEQEHQRAILRAMRALHAYIPPPRPRSRYTAGFPTIQTDQQALRFILDVENTQVSAYADALQNVLTPELRATVASILAAEAEHMSVVLGELHQPQAPQSLVTGNTPT
jgi:rubrerythrin